MRSFIFQAIVTVKLLQGTDRQTEIESSRAPSRECNFWAGHHESQYLENFDVQEVSSSKQKLIDMNQD